MPQSKKIQEQLNDIYQCRKGGGAFSKALGLQRTTASATWTTNGENVERCWIFPEAASQSTIHLGGHKRTQNIIYRTAACLSEVSVHDWTLRQRLYKNGLHGRAPRGKPLWSKRPQRLVSYFPQHFWGIFCESLKNPGRGWTMHNTVQ